jgi:hypothetical protein
VLSVIEIVYFIIFSFFNLIKYKKVYPSTPSNDNENLIEAEIKKISKILLNVLVDIKELKENNLVLTNQIKCLEIKVKKIENLIGVSM